MKVFFVSQAAPTATQKEKIKKYYPNAVEFMHIPLGKPLSAITSEGNVACYSSDFMAAIQESSNRIEPLVRKKGMNSSSQLVAGRDAWLERMRAADLAVVPLDLLMFVLQSARNIKLATHCELGFSE